MLFKSRRLQCPLWAAELESAWRRIPRRSTLRAMASVCALSLLGCACSETEWDAMYATPEDVQLLPAGGRCEFGNLAHVSRTSAALAGRADPHMLELARLEAERDCYKAAAREARLRLEETGTSMPLK